jgi:hypothetical protein
MQLTFNGDQEMIYIDLQVDGATLVAKPGETYELDEAPDDRWSGSNPSEPKAEADPAGFSPKPFNGAVEVDQPSEGDS